jgi:transposase-like protein
MPELTIGRMAKLYGLHRSTLYEAVEKGRVTAGFNGKGQRVIDLSEMIRVYGEPPGQPQDTQQNPTPDNTDGQTPRPTPDNNALLVELVEINRQQAARLESLESEVRQLREEMRRLPAPAEPTLPPAAQEPQATAQSTPPQASQPPRDFSDLLARFESRTKR